MAGGYDRSGQFISDLFADGNVLKFSYERVMPSFSGSDAASYGGRYDNIADDYSNFGVSLKADVNDSFSYAIIFDEPFGADIFYPGSQSASLFGETFLDLNSRATTFVGRYKFEDGFSVHGGLRYQSLEIDLDLLGQGRSTTSDYSLRSEKSSEIGYLIGAAYERPDAKLMMSLTYNSAIDYSLEAKDRRTSGNFTSYPTGLKTSTPESWNFEFKKGISDTTSLFGSIRYTKWGDFYVPAKALNDASSLGLDYDLAVLEDVTSYKLGVEHAFSEQFSASVAITYEAGSGEDTDTLAIFNGPLGFNIAGSYAVSEQVQIAGSLSYAKFDDASVRSKSTFITQPNLFAELKDNSAFGIGFSVAYKF